MPQVGWLIDGERYPTEQPLALAEEQGHFHGFPPAAWRGLIAKGRRTDGWWLSPSAAAGCPRFRILAMSEPYWLVPEKQWAALGGTAWHGLFERYAAGESELHLRLDLQVPLGEQTVPFELRGTLDAYDPVHRRLLDYKNTEKFKYREAGGKWVNKVFPAPEHVVQANLYRLLLEQNGYPVEQAQIAYFQSGVDPARRVVEVPLWRLEDAYLEAVEQAMPLVLARAQGILPPCRCKFPGWGMDKDLCASVADAEWKGPVAGADEEANPHG